MERELKFNNNKSLTKQQQNRIVLKGKGKTKYTVGTYKCWFPEFHLQCAVQIEYLTII